MRLNPEKPFENYILLFFFVALFLSGCSTTKKTKTPDPREIEVLDWILTNNDFIFYKTITEDWKPIYLYLQPDGLPFIGDCLFTPLLKDKELGLNKEDLNHLQREIKSQTPVNLNNIPIRNKDKLTRKKLVKQTWGAPETTYISMPVLLNDASIAVYYMKSDSSGEFRVLKKIDGVWRIHGFCMTWIS